jgi:hypothetical protein
MTNIISQLGLKIPEATDIAGCGFSDKTGGRLPRVETDWELDSLLDIKNNILG